MLKVYWHCLLKTFANINREDHRLIKYRSAWINELHQEDGVLVRHWCTCGYNFDKSLTAVIDF